MGVELLNGIQLGAETTAKTLVPATAIFAGATVARHRLVPNLVRPAERRGMMVEDFQTKPVGRHVELEMEGYASFDDTLYLIAMTTKGPITPSGDAAALLGDAAIRRACLGGDVAG